eukprot:CAMPEP_0179364946 /NCGR_PEP_ID=MMETSP0797-20121207/82300_1 /TAXON_ID=47934 /ORGANISM="Dinophysis acuminata, Strain DAEP01" /LENGTH=36 /DNA_ID= /DNA_START= /DNA_END= /DNA_ORIENTATION=
MPGAMILQPSSLGTLSWLARGFAAAPAPAPGAAPYP